MASIYPRNGSLWISYYLPSGKRERKPLDLPDTREGWREAEHKCRQVEVMLKEDPLGFKKQVESVKRKITMSQLWTNYSAYRCPPNKKTAKDYKYAFETLKAYTNDVSIDRVTDEVLSGFEKETRESKSPATSAFCLRHCKVIFRWAVEKRYIYESPFVKGLVYDAGGNPPQIFRDEELEEIYKKLRPKIYHQVKFLELSGFRCLDSCNFLKRYVNMDERLIEYHNSKGERAEPFPIYDDLYELLESVPKLDGALLFPYRSPTTLNHYFNKAMKASGIEINGRSIHNLKDTYVSRLIRNPRLSPTEVHFLSHHEDMATTLKYYAWFDTHGLRKKMDKRRKKKVA